MKTAPECMSCFINQAMLTARQVSDDPALAFGAQQAAARCFDRLTMDASPPENSRLTANAVNEFLGDADPFAAARARYNALALGGLDALRDHVQTSPDPLAAAVRTAAVGNILDLSLFADVEMADVLADANATPWAINHIDHLRADLDTAQDVLILGDNAGEIVFDLPLAELLRDGLGLDVTYAVKSGPAANDVTRADAEQVGMDKAAAVVDLGCAYQGTPLHRCSPEFLALFERADVILSKGQGNFETLSDADANLYFFVKAKCGPVARELGVDVGDIVMASQRERVKNTHAS